MKNLYRSAAFKRTMRCFARASFGLLWTAFSVAAFAADTATAASTASTRDTGVFMVAGALLILLGLIGRRAKN